MYQTVEWMWLKTATNLQQAMTNNQQMKNIPQQVMTFKQQLRNNPQQVAVKLELISKRQTNLN